MSLSLYFAYSHTIIHARLLIILIIMNAPRPGLDFIDLQTAVYMQGVFIVYGTITPFQLITKLIGLLFYYFPPSVCTSFRLITVHWPRCMPPLTRSSAVAVVADRTACSSTMYEL